MYEKYTNLLELPEKDKKGKFEQEDLIYEISEKAKKEINKILVFGRSNTKEANNAANLYHAKKRGQRLMESYSRVQLDALFAVFASDLKDDENITTTGELDFFYSLKEAFISGIGSCEHYAIVRAYVLAQHYDFMMMIESISTNDQRHTYLRLQLDGFEALFDDWTENLSCRYGDWLTYNECVRPEFSFEEGKSKFFTEIKCMSSKEIREIGKSLITENLQLQRCMFLKRVKENVNDYLKLTINHSLKIGIFERPIKRGVFEHIIDSNDHEIIRPVKI